MQKAPLLGSDGSPLDALPHLGRCSITYLNGMCGTFLLMAVWFTAFPQMIPPQMIPQVQLEVPVRGSRVHSLIITCLVLCIQSCLVLFLFVLECSI